MGMSNETEYLTIGGWRVNQAEDQRDASEGVVRKSMQRDG